MTVGKRSKRYHAPEGSTEAKASRSSHGDWKGLAKSSLLHAKLSTMGKGIEILKRTFPSSSYLIVLPIEISTEISHLELVCRNI